MRIALLSAGLALVVVASAWAATARTPDGAAATKAKLTLTRAAPLTLRGTRFVDGERVRLIVVARKRITKQLRANDAGAFAVRFPGISVGRCAGYKAFAIGAQGSRASLGAPDVYRPPPR
jgi:hypothetical protein